MPAKDPADRAAVINAILVSVTIAAAAFGAHAFWPWLVGNVMLGVVVAAIGAGAGFFEFLFDEELKLWVRERIGRRHVRTALIASLELEAVVLIVLLSLPATVVRIVPGKDLDFRFPFEGATLRLELDGRVFESRSPKAGVVYCGAAERVRYLFSEEPEQHRKDVLTDIAQRSIGATDAKTYLDRWMLYEPILMDEVSGGGGRLRAVLIQGGKRQPLRLTKWLTNDEGIETYVADFE